MTAASLWADVLKRYGQPVSLWRDGEERKEKAFFQPVEEKSAGWIPSPLGPGPAGKYLYLGPVHLPLDREERLGWQGRSFRCLRTRPYYVGEELVYHWAIFEEEEAEG